MLPAGLVAASLFIAAVLAFPGSDGVRRRAVVHRLRNSAAEQDRGRRGGATAHVGATAHKGRDGSGRGGVGRGGAAAGSGYRGLESTAIMIELVAAALESGASLGRALELLTSCSAPAVRDSLRPVVAALAIGADWETAWRSSAVRNPVALRLRDSLAFAALTGAPSSAVLFAQAARLRREEFRAAERRAAALGVKLVVPLGLCSLPAFLCLGVVPVLLAMLPSGP
ncbi:type II secretion system F family protein [Arthrobacter cupressi]